jgi:hypothetical protein
MRRLLVLVLLLIGGLQVLQASEYRTSRENEAGASHAGTPQAGMPHAGMPHSCCPSAGAHASCCPDACSSPAAIANSTETSLWCGRRDHVAALEAGAFMSRRESPLIRPPIL